MRRLLLPNRALNKGQLFWCFFWSCHHICYLYATNGLLICNKWPTYMQQMKKVKPCTCTYIQKVTSNAACKNKTTKQWEFTEIEIIINNTENKQTYHTQPYSQRSSGIKTIYNIGKGDRTAACCFSFDLSWNKNKSVKFSAHFIIGNSRKWQKKTVAVATQNVWELLSHFWS